jgi:MtrB/PioB family decaheme-associated outer membrane protein
MSTSRMLLAAGLTLLPILAAAQPAQPDQSTPTGVIDIGVRGTGVEGDGARYERYRDLGDGLFLETFRLNAQKNGWFLAAAADHAGRRDQRYAGSFVSPGKFKGWAMWDQIPMLLSRTTRTLYTEDLDEPQGVLTIDNAIQSLAQASPAALSTIFPRVSTEFETRTRRDIALAGFEYLLTSELTVRSTIQHTHREGSIPYGGSFGHSSLVEIPAPVQHDLTDFEGGAEFSRDPLLFRAGYAGSWFRNAFTAATFDNPFRAVDISTASSRGRLSLAPSNSFVSVNGLASVKLPRRSRATAYVSVGALDDNGAAIMPQTINTANTTAPLERAQIEGEARTTAANLSFVSRPSRYVDVDVRYRTYDYDNRTPEFAMTERVAYDNAPSAVVPAVDTEPFGVNRQTFDADFRVTPATRATAGIGYTRLVDERTHRIYESTTDNVLRLTFDSVGNQWFSLRTKYEHAEKRGRGLDEALLTGIGEQPGLRHFDVAARDRDRLTLLVSMMPPAAANLALNVSVALGKDDYLESLFGLRDNTHRVYSVGLDATPTALIVVGGSYSYEHYNALSRSRQADNAAQFVDPSRNWASDGTDRVHSIILNAAVSRIADKIDLAFNYDFNRARATYEYITGAVPDRTLPEEVVVTTTLPTPRELPVVRSELQRGAADFVYALTARVGLGLSYWYERYRVADFTLDAEATPDLARGQTLLMGYLYRPYTANTVWARLVYRW